MMKLNRRGFLGALAAGTVGIVTKPATAAGAAPVGVPAAGRTGLKTKVTPYFDGGWTVYMFGNRGYGQMLSTLFLSPSGKVVMVDGGDVADSEFLYETLKELGGKVDTWFITHAHTDHYRALQGILERPKAGGIRIGRLVHSFPTLEWVDAHEKGCMKFLPHFLDLVKKSGVKVEKPKMRQVFDFGEGMTFECLNQFDDRTWHNGINNSSICYRVENGGKSLLVVGDLGVEGGNWALKWVPHEKLKCDVVFMAHHGQSGVDRPFYEAVKPEICVWPTPEHVWDNNPADGVGSGGWKTNYVKCWMQDLGCKRQYLLCRGDVALGPK